MSLHEVATAAWHVATWAWGHIDTIVLVGAAVKGAGILHGQWVDRMYETAVRVQEVKRKALEAKGKTLSQEEMHAGAVSYLARQGIIATDERIKVAVHKHTSPRVRIKRDAGGRFVSGAKG